MEDMKFAFLFAALTFLSVVPILAQKKPAEPKYLDFWVGDWNGTWPEPGGKQGTARNRITKDMNGKIVHERFEILTGANKGFKGESWSAVDGSVGHWRQTWVDNSGGYIALDAEPEPGGKGFRRKFTGPKGKEVVQRMRFTEIQKDRFVWIWESSVDGEKTWTENWKIEYTRRK